MKTPKELKPLVALWKQEYKELLHNEDNYYFMLRRLKEKPLTEDTSSRIAALHQLIDECYNNDAE